MNAVAEFFDAFTSWLGTHFKMRTASLDKEINAYEGKLLERNFLREVYESTLNLKGWSIFSKIVIRGSQAIIVFLLCWLCVIDFKENSALFVIHLLITLFTASMFCFTLYALDLFFIVLYGIFFVFISAWLLEQAISLSLVGKAVLLIFLPIIIEFYFILIYFLPSWCRIWFRTIVYDKDRQAHMLFMLSMAVLAWGLWLQSGGNWQQIAVLKVPIFEIPWTESLGFPLAIVGFVHDPVGSAVSSVVQASANQTLVIILAAVALFALAENRLHQSAVGVRPKFAALVFALLVVSVCLEIALHAAGAPDLPSVLILFNRAFAVLALGVYLFWRRVAKNGEPVRGADGEFRKACDYAEKQALKIALWLLGLVWLATQLSHGFPNGFPPLVLSAFGIAASFPFVWMVNFKREFDNQLGHYNEALRMQRASYEPPPISASDDEIRRALGDEDKDAPP